MIEKIELLLEANGGQMPDSPDNMKVVNYSGGLKPSKSLGKKSADLRYQNIQVMVRNQSYFNALKECESVIELLEGYSDDEDILNIQMTGDILPLGRDSKNRYTFTLNFQVMKVEK